MEFNSESKRFKLDKNNLKPSKKVGKLIEDDEELANCWEMPFANIIALESYFTLIAMLEQRNKPTFFFVQDRKGLITMPDLGNVTLINYLFDSDDEGWDGYLVRKLISNAKSDQQRKKIQTYIAPLLPLFIRVAISKKIIAHLQRLQKHDMIQRDIKLENIILPYFEKFIELLSNPANWNNILLLEACLIDFGLSHSAKDKVARTHGSPAYKAPEIASDNLDKEYPSLTLSNIDNFSAGITICRLLELDDFILTKESPTNGKDTCSPGDEEFYTAEEDEFSPGDEAFYTMGADEEFCPEKEYEVITEEDDEFNAENETEINSEKKYEFIIEEKNELNTKSESEFNSDEEGTWYVKYDVFTDLENFKKIVTTTIQQCYQFLPNENELDGIINLLSLDNHSRGSLEAAVESLDLFLKRILSTLLKNAKDIGLISDVESELSLNVERVKPKLDTSGAFQMRRLGYLTFLGADNKKQMKAISIADIKPDQPSQMSFT
jgi:serine/threonine protein kinase